MPGNALALTPQSAMGNRQSEILTPSAFFILPSTFPCAHVGIESQGRQGSDQPRGEVAVFFLWQTQRPAGDLINAHTNRGQRRTSSLLIACRQGQKWQTDTGTIFPNLIHRFHINHPATRSTMPAGPAYGLARAPIAKSVPEAGGRNASACYHLCPTVSPCFSA